MYPSSNRWKITGGRIGVVFGETLCLPAGRQGVTFSALIPHIELASDLTCNPISSNNYPLLKLAIQGFGEDRTGPPAARQGRITKASTFR
jgi:hypothetical protein